MSSGPTLDAYPVPAGGSVLLIPTSSDTNIVINRQSVNTGVTVEFYNGPFDEQARFIDLGDNQGVTAPLSQSDTFIYTITDSFGTYSTPPVAPIMYVVVNEDEFSKIILELFAVSMRTLAKPKGYKVPQVLYQMPDTGFPPLPAIHIIQDYYHSEEIPIGQNAFYPDNDNTINIPTIVERHFLVTILATSAEEREYYRSAVIAVFLSLLNNPIQSLGNNVRHAFDSSASQVHEDGFHPGFFFADVGISFSGTFNATLTTNYNLIENSTLDVTPT